MILGVVLAGGQSTRFGSDKALARLDGTPLLSHAVDQLSGWCEQVVIVGREEGPAPCIPDWPHTDMGPLGGIAAALHHAFARHAYAYAAPRHKSFDKLVVDGIHGEIL